MLHRGSLRDGDPALELAVAHAMVRRAGLGEIDSALRIYRPTATTLTFGRREVRLEGFGDAVRAVRAAGFVPTIRATGGRTVAYTEQAVVVDHVVHDPHAAGALDGRFEDFGRRFADAFRGLGVDAQVGPVPGEYCPGAHSVNARGVVKLVGTAQRVIRNAWLFSSLVVVGDTTMIKPLLGEVYGLLGQEFDDASVGALSDEVPSLDVARVEQAVLAAYAETATLEPAPLDAATLELAHDLVDQHRVSVD